MKSEKELLDTYRNVAARAKLNYDFITDDYAVELIDHSENATFLVDSNKKNEKYILRVCRPNYHRIDEIKSEITFLNLLLENVDVEMTQPLMTQSNDYVQTIKVNDGIDYYAIVFKFLEGDMPNVDNEEKLVKIFYDIGKITAQFHTFSIENSEKLENLKRPIWDFESILGEKPKWGRWQEGLGLTEERYQLLERVSQTIKKRLNKFSKSKDHFGLIHADLRHANLLVDNNNNVSVIDFDDSGFGYYLFDLAASLSFVEHRSYVPKLIESWIAGYNTVKKLTKEEIDEIPTFIMLRRLQLISWVGSRDNETARELGSEYTRSTDAIALDYLEKFE